MSWRFCTAAVLRPLLIWFIPTLLLGLTDSQVLWCQFIHSSMGSRSFRATAPRCWNSPPHPHLYKSTESICLLSDIKMFWFKLLLVSSAFCLGSLISLSFTFCSRCFEAYLGLWKAFYVYALLLNCLVQSNQIWENSLRQLYSKRLLNA